jgi:hypothetical protein
MDELIQRITAATGLDPATAQQAVGIILGFLKSHAPAGPVGDLINSIPGADTAVAEHGSEGGGGLMGSLGGMMGGGAGGLMALAGKLTGAGLDMSQMQATGREIFQYAKGQVGEEKLGEIASSVPGLAQMM